MTHSPTASTAPPTTLQGWCSTTFGPVAVKLTQDPSVPLRAACVLLPPIGYPYWSSYRTSRELAEALARLGVACLRVDYHGTADSAGTGWEPDRLIAWQDTCDTLVAALREATSLPVGAVGLQLGASLALRSRRALDFVVAWEPVTSGRRFARSLKLLGMAMPEVEGVVPGITMAGFPLTAQTLGDLARVTSYDGAGAPDVLVVAAPGDAPEVEALLAGDPERRVDVVHPEGDSVMAGLAEELDPPRRTVAAVARWVEERVGTDSSATEGPLELPGLAAELVPDETSGCTERVVEVGPRGLVGVLGHPATGPSRSVVVFLNSGSEPRVGPGRAWVDYGRALNEAGISTLRVDFTGWGESPDEGHAPGRPFDAHCVPEAVEIVESLRAEGYRVVLSGLCAGAWVALKVALLTPVAGVAAINAEIFWRPGDPIEALASTTVARRTPIRAREARGARWGLWSAMDLVGLSNYAGRWLTRLQRTGVPVRLLFSDSDEGLLFLRNRLGRRVRRTTRSGTMRVVEVPDIDHAMHRSWLRGALVAELVDFALDVDAR